MDSIPITIHARDVYVKLILNEVKVTTFDLPRLHVTWADCPQVSITEWK